MELTRGMRDKLSDYLDISQPIEVIMQVSSGCEFKFCCFGIDSDEVLSDEKYMVFSKHISSPNGEINFECEDNKAVITVMPEKLPENIKKLVFAAFIIGNGTMNNIYNYKVSIGNVGKPELSMTLESKDFRSEKVIEAVDIYYKNEWRFSAPATGFNRGIGQLLKHYGESEKIMERLKKMSEGQAEEAVAESNEAEIEFNEPLEQEWHEEDVQPVEETEPEWSAEAVPVQTIEPEQTEEEELPPVQTIEPEQFEEEELPPVQTIEPEQFEEEELLPVQTIEPEQTVIPPVQTIGQDAFEDYDAAASSTVEEADDSAQGWMFEAKPAEEIPPVQTINEETEETENEPESTAEHEADDWIFDADDVGETVVPEPQKAEIPANKPQNSVPLDHRLRNDMNIAHLAAPVTYQLEVKQLGECVARVALVMDMTGSMRRAYGSGLVQFVISKMLPLAVQFDDDGQLDFWYYANDFERRPSISLENYQYAVPQNWGEVMDSLGIVNNEPAVMEDVMRKFSQTKLPVYVIFVTDGGAAYHKKIAELLTEYSYKPIFWQFVGINGSNYGIFENLDVIRNRYVNNASFFAFDDIRTVPDDFLYDRLLNDFSLWYREIKRLGMI